MGAKPLTPLTLRAGTLRVNMQFQEVNPAHGNEVFPCARRNKR